MIITKNNGTIRKSLQSLMTLFFLILFSTTFFIKVHGSSRVKANLAHSLSLTSLSNPIKGWFISKPSKDSSLKVRMIHHVSVFYDEKGLLVTKSNLCDPSHYVEIYFNGDIIITDETVRNFQYNKTSELESTNINGVSIIKNKVISSFGAEHIYQLVMQEGLEVCELSVTHKTPKDKNFIKSIYLLDFKKNISR